MPKYERNDNTCQPNHCRKRNNTSSHGQKKKGEFLAKSLNDVLPNYHNNIMGTAPSKKKVNLTTLLYQTRTSQKHLVLIDTDKVDHLVTLRLCQIKS
jgi:bisphosphoglycerate-dependent phosphoglycerate mutase